MVSFAPSQIRDIYAVCLNCLLYTSQEYNLLDTLTIEENIALALTIKEEAKEKIKDTVHSLAADLAITEVLHKFPYEVSGGQRQRCACARAFVTNPSLILDVYKRQLHRQKKRHYRL